MGSGKTESAISLMNEDTENRYIFLTPYLKEIERIETSCPKKKFFSPINKGKGKLENLHCLLERKYNIASTHALFSAYTEQTSELIRKGQYKLILDEVFDVIELMPLKKSDIDVIFKSGLAKISNDNEHVIWLDENYKGTRFEDVMNKAKSNNLICYKDSFLFWNFPISIFNSFQEVIILTYMFDSQPQKYYYDMNGIEVEYIGTQNVNGKFEFSKTITIPESYQSLKKRIHILDEPKINRIGDFEFALSSTWFSKEKDKKEKLLLQRLKNNLYNVFRNKFKGSSSQNMWTTFKDYKKTISGKGYTSGFVPCNLRATNDYRDKIYLAYCLNIFLNPVFRNYFISHGAKIDEDKYALSEMLQWIWRSAIRDGKDIWIYIPSMRMRNLLVSWLDSFSETSLIVNNKGEYNG